MAKGNRPAGGSASALFAKSAIDLGNRRRRSTLAEFRNSARPSVTSR